MAAFIISACLLPTLAPSSSATSSSSALFKPSQLVHCQKSNRKQAPELKPLPRRAAAAASDAATAPFSATEAWSPQQQRAVIIGGGPSGALMAAMLANRGVDVDVYERVQLAADVAEIEPATKSDDDQNAAAPSRSDRFTYPIRLTTRATSATCHAGIGLPETVAVPTPGAVIHFSKGSKSLFRAYEKEEGAVQVDRNSLAEYLVGEAARHTSGRVKVHFGWTLKELSSDGEEATLVRTGEDDESERGGEGVEGSDGDGAGEGEGNTKVVRDFDVLVGADGVKSVVRSEIARWDKTFSVKQIENKAKFKRLPLLSRSSTDASELFSKFPANCIHAFPSKKATVIAGVKAGDGSYVAVLISNETKQFKFKQLKTEEDVKALFSQEHPQLLEVFFQDDPNFCRSVLSQPTAKGGTSTWVNRLHWGRRCVLIGDAAHSMVASYGYGCNSALEDCQVLDKVLEAHTDKASGRIQFDKAIEDFTKTRLDDVRAIVDLSFDPPNAAFATNRWTFVKALIVMVVFGVIKKFNPSFDRPRGVKRETVRFSQIKKEVEEDTQLALKIFASFIIALVSVVLFFF